MAEVILILKTGKRATNITSNSLISLLDVLGKILDKIIQYHLLENNQTRHNNLATTRVSTKLLSNTGATACH